MADPPISMRAEEEALIDAFIHPSRRARLKELLAKPKRRRAATAKLVNFLDIVDPRWIVPLPLGEQKASDIERELLRRGAGPTCYVVSEYPQCDGKRMPLREALDGLVGLGAGTLLSCVPGTLGYWEGEAKYERCILARHAAPKGD